jgi:Toprim-like
VAERVQRVFLGKQVVIVPDNDKAGHEHAEQVANHLIEIASRVEILELPETVKDISDFAAAQGARFSEAFSELLKSAREFIHGDNGAQVPPQMQDSASPRDEDDLHEQSAKAEFEDCIILPSGPLGIHETAEKAFRILAKSKKLFVCGGRVFELIRDKKDQALRLEILSEQSFRSRIELHGRILAWRAGPHGGYVLKSGARCSLDTATVWLASSAIDILPPIVAVHRSPTITQNGTSTQILGKGYHSDCGGRFVIDGETSPTKMKLGDAIELLLDGLSEFSFQTPADRSRAISAIITPALVFGELFTAHVPVFVIEADKSQTGKGFLLEVIQMIFGEIPTIIAQREGGVGGFDESLAQALLNGRPFIQLDNMRGRFISQYLEMILTCPPTGSVGARVPYKGETQIQPSRFLFQLTSNGFESTRDLANRSCIIRLLKRRGYAFRKYPEGDLLDHIRAHQGKYQSAVFRVVEEWVKRGKPTTASDTRGEGKFRRWAQAFDWIVREFFNLPPLMDGHEKAQERTANPALSWLRQVCIAAESDSRLDEDLTATDIIEICHGHSIEIPGLPADATEKKTQLRVGTIMGKIFKEADVVDGDGFILVKTTETQYDEDKRHEFELKKYQIRKEAACD